jgi:hypothetical protein
VLIWTVTPPFFAILPKVRGPLPVQVTVHTDDESAAEQPLGNVPVNLLDPKFNAFPPETIGDEGALGDAMLDTVVRRLVAVETALSPASGSVVVVLLVWTADVPDGGVKVHLLDDGEEPEP